MILRRFGLPFVVFAVIAVLAAFGLRLPQLNAAQTGTKWALLVGIDDYENDDINDLRFAIADVKAVTDALKKNAGFPQENVWAMTSDTPSGIYRPTAVNVFDRLDFFAKKIQSNDTFLFYFSGHGYSRDGRHFLATVNAVPTSIGTLKVSSIPVDMLREEMSRIQARKVIFIIDACRSDPGKGKDDKDNLRTADFSRSLIDAAKAAGAGIAGSAVFFACSEGERAYEWNEKEHGVFTYYLLEGLRGEGAEPTGELTVTSLADYVQKSVVKWSEEHNKKQTPDLKQEGAAKILLAEHVIITARLQITTSPPGAKVSVDSEEVKDKVTPCTIEIDMGRLKTKQIEIAVKLDGYEPDVRAVTLERGEIKQLELPLQRISLKPTPFVPTPIDYTSLTLWRTLEGHIDNVTSVAFSPDGNTLASGGDDRRVRLWDTQTGELKWTLKGHIDSVTSVAFSHDGKTLASVGRDVSVILWDARSGELKQKLTEHIWSVTSVAFSPDSKTLACNSYKEVKLWNAQTGELKQTLTGHDSSVTSIVFSPDGKTLASGSYDETVKLWAAQTGELKQTLIGHELTVYSVAFSPDDKTLASGSDDKTVILWDVQTGELKQTLTGHDSSVTSVAFSPDGKTLASGSYDRTVRLWDVQTGELKRTLDESGLVTSVAFSPDGKTLALGNYDDTVKLWRVE